MPLIDVFHRLVELALYCTSPPFVIQGETIEGPTLIEMVHSLTRMVIVS